jgi:hypothetical protein
MESVLPNFGKPIENKIKLQHISTITDQDKTKGLEELNLKIHTSFIGKEYDIVRKNVGNEIGISEFEMNEELTESDQVLVWTSIRPWAALNISCWDFLCDKAKWAEYPCDPNEKDQYNMNPKAYKIQVYIRLFERVLKEG